MDFVQVCDRVAKNGVEVYPSFFVGHSDDLMIRGGAFHAIWDEDAGLWDTDETTVQRLIDIELKKRAIELASSNEQVAVRSLRIYNSKSWSEFRRYTRDMPENPRFRQLDSRITFKDAIANKKAYSSKRLHYTPSEGPIDAYDELMTVLYEPEEREKLEWGIGAVLSGDSVKIQKFFVLYGEAGTGKGTFLGILEDLFEGYVAIFDARALTGSKNAFGTASFKDNPLVGIQHDGDLSRIEDNTILNSVVSHELIKINEKFKAEYTGRINAMLFIGTNQSVKITDSSSGLIRRLIDVHPTGDRLPAETYSALTQRIKTEHAAIAWHCLQVYRQGGKHRYASYTPVEMMLRTDHFYSFMIENFDVFMEKDGVSLETAWKLYKEFCAQSNFKWTMDRSRVQTEMSTYFKKFHARHRTPDGHIRNYYSGFKKEKLTHSKPEPVLLPSLVMEEKTSLVDDVLAECPAQYQKDDGTPANKWEKVKTKLKDLDTTKLHYVQPGLQHIVIDFDLRNDRGEKDAGKNLAAASLWPPTYSEFSQGGSGIHLHYNFEGDVSELSPLFEPDIEVKIFSGGASLRRRLSACNNVQVATLRGGLPIKERRVPIDADTIKTEQGLRRLIERNLQKEIHPGTKPSIDFIWKILEDAYNEGLRYDVTDMRSRLLAFANGSTHQAQYCIRVVMAMKFQSENLTPPSEAPPWDDRLVFFDVESYPNLFVICWKYKDSPNVVKMINPERSLVEELCNYKLVGFNNRKYDNHMLYAAVMGYTVEQLFQLSQRIVQGSPGAMFSDAYNLSYADIFDFSTLKQGLKRFQIELGLNHDELPFPWDQPVPEDQWMRVTEYCANDVVTTEAVFNSRKQDFVARQILAAVSGLKVNDTTQRHTAQIIFGGARHPQAEFKYTDLATVFPGYTYDPYRVPKSDYLGEDPSEGGYVHAEPGMYSDVAVLDVASMHPTSIVLLDLFGPYTERFAAIKDVRVAIKRKDYDYARKALGGALAPYLDSEDDAAALSYALKIAINIVYGLTSASFDNPFHDPNNKDNIAAKRGALFMIALQHALQEDGIQVVHIKTDSIKIPNASPEVIQFVMDFGKQYGYEFEHEGTYKKFCLVNDAVYIAQDSETGKWSATGAQFAEPYVYKKLFSHEEIGLADLVQMKSVLSPSAMWLDFPEGRYFIGRAGGFVPVMERGAPLLRIKEGKEYNVTGTKGYLWAEASVVEKMPERFSIDWSYFEKIAKAAVDNISQYGDFEEFAQ